MNPSSIEDIFQQLKKYDYVADRALATAVFLAIKMGRPLFLEGEAGVGKTEIAKVLSKMSGTRLIRLQCYEGLDQSAALYDWNFPRQMIQIRLGEAKGSINTSAIEENIFSEQFLIKRPLLEAIWPHSDEKKDIPAPVLLIDELDRADEPFEAFLLEILSDFQVTIPELGTIKASNPPLVVITSNRTREIHDAVKRRCIYHWVEYPSLEQEVEILKRKVGDISNNLAREIVKHVQHLRQEDLFKKPGTAETLDWAYALKVLNEKALSKDIIDNTLGVLLKYQDDIEKVSEKR